MLKQRTLKKAIKTTGVGLHTGARVEMTLRPAAADTGIVFHRTDLARPVSIPAHASQRRRHAAVVHARGRRRDASPRSSTSCRRWPAWASTTARRHRRTGAADHGRQRRPVRVPAAIGRHRGAGGPQALSSRPVSRSRCTTATSGRASRRTTASGSTSRSTFRIPCSVPRTATSSSTSRTLPTRRRSRARARSASCRMSRPCAPRAWALAAACRTRSCSTSSRS